MQWEAEFKTVEELAQPASHLRASDIIDNCAELNLQAEAATKATKLRRAAESLSKRLRT